MGSVQVDLLTLITTCITSLVAIGGLWLSIAKYNREARKERQEYIEKQLNMYNKVNSLISEVQLLHSKVDYQENMVKITQDVVNSHFRMELFSCLTKALNRGYTTISEAVEVNKLYMIYKNNGGNGEIKLLFQKYDKLKIEEEEYEEN